jgi:hypothetical protein
MFEKSKFEKLKKKSDSHETTNFIHKIVVSTSCAYLGRVYY